VFYLYFGCNNSVKSNIEEGLRSDVIRLDIAKLHDQVSDDIREENVAWIDGLNRNYGDNIEWWCGAISTM